MRFRKVLFIRPNFPGGKYGATRPPAGLAYLSEFLETMGVETRFLDFAATPSRRRLERALADFAPDIVGVSMFSYRYRVAYELATLIKKLRPEALTIAGGPHVSTYRERVLTACPALDLGVTREGEETLLEICQGRPFEDIPGLLYRCQTEVRYTGDRPFRLALDELPAPTYRRFDLTGYVDEKVIISSRGCPFDCAFCSVRTSMGRRMRFRSPANVVDEVEYWWKRGTRKFDFQDDNFTFDPERVLSICDLIEKRGLTGLLLRCSNGIRADRVDFDLLKRMSQVGFRSVGIGVESGSDRVLQLMRKAEKVERIDAAIRDACALDYDVHLFFIFGFPGESETDLEASEQLALRYPVLKVNFYNVIPFPGTALYDLLQTEGLLKRSAEVYLNETLNYSDEILFTTPDRKSVV